jgi:hypothetical protein
MKGDVEIKVLCSALLHSSFTEERVLLCNSLLST